MSPPSQLKIKVSALGRLLKEEKYYYKELADQQAVVDKLKADPSTDKYDLKKQLDVLEDTKQMIPELRKKIKAAASGLTSFLETVSPEEDTTEAKDKIEQAENLS